MGIGSRTRLALAAAAVLCVAVSSRAQEDAWPEFRFLIGEWVADAKPGEGTGSFSLAPDLQGKILVRKNRAEVVAAQGRPAGTHEDLMVIHREEGTRQVRASYFDNEGHVIQYKVAPAAEGTGLVFVSEAQAGTPRFRLTYTAVAPNGVKIVFEIAPPGQPEQFRTYLEGTARRAEPARAGRPSTKK